MGDAAGEGAEGLHFLGLRQFPFESEPLFFRTGALGDFSREGVIRLAQFLGSFGDYLFDDACPVAPGHQILKQPGHEQQTDCDDCPWNRIERVAELTGCWADDDRPLAPSNVIGSGTVQAREDALDRLRASTGPVERRRVVVNQGLAALLILIVEIDVKFEGGRELFQTCLDQIADPDDANSEAE